MVGAFSPELPVEKLLELAVNGGVNVVSPGGRERSQELPRASVFPYLLEPHSVFAAQRKVVVLFKASLSHDIVRAKCFLAKD
jgi:hypothetical protein